MNNSRGLFPCNGVLPPVIFFRADGKGLSQLMTVVLRPLRSCSEGDLLFCPGRSTPSMHVIPFGYLEPFLRDKSCPTRFKTRALPQCLAFLSGVPLRWATEPKGTVPQPFTVY